MRGPSIRGMYNCLGLNVAPRRLDGDKSARVSVCDLESRCIRLQIEASALQYDSKESVDKFVWPSKSVRVYQPQLKSDMADDLHLA
jgi:hypothetical protein